MHQFKVLKKANEIFELCIAYGLCRILEMNCIKWSLENKNAYYLVETESFERNDLVFIPLEKDKLWNINSTLHNREKEEKLKKINKYFDNDINFKTIFDYYETHDESILKKAKDERATHCGSCYYSKGLRSANVGTDAKRVKDFESHLSVLGFIISNNYFITEKEINMMLVPKKIDRLKMPYTSIKIDKETGNKKIRSYFKNDFTRITIAQIYLNTIKSFKNENTVKDYSKIIITQLQSYGQAKSKPMFDKSMELKILPLKSETIIQLLQNIHDENDEVALSTAEFILNPNSENISKMIQYYAKHKKTIRLDSLKELISLASEEMFSLFNNNSILHLSNELKKIYLKGRYYEIKALLFMFENINLFTKSFKKIKFHHDEYLNNRDINNDQFKEVEILVNSNKRARMIGDLFIALIFVCINEDFERELINVE